MQARRNLLAIAAGLTLLALLSAVWGIVNHQRQIYAAEWLSKAYPTVAPPFQVTSQEPGAAATLLLLGDSRVADWRLPTLPGWRVVNAGVPGMTSSELVLIASDVLIKSNPQVVVIQAGVNELKIIGVRDDLYEPLISLCHSNLLKVVQLAEERGARVLLTPIWPTGSVPWQRSLVWSARVPRAIEEVNRRLRESLNANQQARLFDVFVPSDSSPAKPAVEPQLRDTLHFTPAFYEELTGRLVSELER